jgi:phosphotransferase system HPr-like phosphotransfer protein
MNLHQTDFERRTSVRVPLDLRSSHHLAEATATLVHGFKSEIDLRVGDISIDAKSSAMARAFLEVLRGRTVELVVWGEDSVPALRSLAALFKQALGVHHA